MPWRVQVVRHSGRVHFAHYINDFFAFVTEGEAPPGLGGTPVALPQLPPAWMYVPSPTEPLSLKCRCQSST